MIHFQRRSVKFRGHSSAGRASDLHSEGRRFDPCCLHQLVSQISPFHLDKGLGPSGSQGRKIPLKISDLGIIRFFWKSRKKGIDRK